MRRNLYIEWRYGSTNILRDDEKRAARYDTLDNRPHTVETNHFNIVRGPRVIDYYIE